MTARNTAISLLLIAFLGACSYPRANVATVDARPTLAFTNARSSSSLSVDGAVVGPAARFDGKNEVLRLERGTHRIEVQDLGRKIFSEVIYLDDGMTKSINLPE